MAAANNARWHRDTRYYEACVAADLFRQPCLILTYGRIGTRLGRQRTLTFASAAMAAEAFARVAKRRLARGYTPCTGSPA